ncbi:MAG: hypothetical protein A2561_03625 [Candidatus Staskawiczbacteria bacterium RIFOXYD1_FULL_32_13]|uniref:ParB/Sulfiredoxin domain-containing protein n=1 Tax=Candidatus Staskawiczbacteria bacterium RIFOXYD1_FULL_32_13 TaxID=1802234 RepID=A0A1G2JKU6_9BACT|nr:MAG: hypothetical protein A2256_03975 [Candidatus Staskawiczbacteria bacterium RIFOXYA2_FULL_32_7]OGZ87755.1 MAG: hypothetical protein A2561_03625 [Candidatus Staskawiczbacteria bacterium RIFOXYD1_FULL_32_13]
MIDQNTFVRDSISTERLDMLKLLIEGGTKLPPIVLVPAYEVIRGEICSLNNNRYSMVDGRHRLWLYKDIFEYKEVSALIVSGITTEAQLISVAFQLNAPDGPLSPGKKDIEHTITELLRRKVPKKDIPGLLGYDEVAIKKYINDVESKLKHATTVRAYKRVVEENLTVAEAAKAEGANPESVRNYISRGRRVTKEVMDEMTAEMKTVFKSLHASLHGNSRSISKKLDDGDLTSDNGIALYDMMEQGLVKAMKIVKNESDRFIAKVEE